MLRYPEVPIGGVLVACPRCPRPQPVSPLFAEDVRTAIPAAIAAGGGAVALVGDDAFAREDWRTLVADALAAGATRLRLDGGQALRLDGAAEEAVDAGVRHVRIGAVDASSDSVCGAAAAAFLSVARASGVRAVATALVPVCRHNLHSTPVTVTALAEAGVSTVTLACADPTMAVGPAAPWIVAAADSGTVNRVWVSIQGFPVEAMPGYEIHFTKPFALAGEM